jgi:hypothetical protein
MTSHLIPPPPHYRYVILLTTLLLTGIFSCKKEDFKNNPAPSPVSASLLADSNFVAMSVAGRAGINNAKLTSQVSSKSVNGILALPDKQVLDSLALPTANNPSYYLFNYLGGGFAIVSADKRADPILAYSDMGYFNTKASMNPGLSGWLKVTDKNMQLLRSHPELKAPKKTAKFWAYLLTKKAPPVNNITANALKVDKVEPIDTCVEHWQTFGVDSLLRTSWDQTWPYNAYCPASPDPAYSFSNGLTPTGCVATAMAQVMRYWQYPASYDYSSMPATLPVTYPSLIPSLAHLMVDAGTAVSMVYDDNGSHPFYNWLTSPISPAQGLKYLGYSSADHSDYTDGNCWDVVDNLNNHWPVILAGFPSDGPGHVWVCDGYMESYYYQCDSIDSDPNVTIFLLLHMNWGFNGASDGYYSFSNWTVLEGSGYSSYNEAREFNYNIHP